MPHWINLSYYSKPHRLSICHRNFVPRVRLPAAIEDLIPDDKNVLNDVYFPRIDPLPDFGD
jgi:hypothetical protein